MDTHTRKTTHGFSSLGRLLACFWLVADLADYHPSHPTRSLSSNFSVPTSQHKLAAAVCSQVNDVAAAGGASPERLHHRLNRSRHSSLGLISKSITSFYDISTGNLLFSLVWWNRFTNVLADQICRFQQSAFAVHRKSGTSLPFSSSPCYWPTI
jgi:hypothetical protein